MAEKEFDLKELETWLNTQPRDVSLAIAARAALRVNPLLMSLVRAKPAEYASTILLPVLRATAVPWASAGFPARGTDLRAAAYAAAAAATDAARAAATTDAATAYTAYTAYAAARAATASAAITATDAASAASAATASATASARAVGRDCMRVEQGTTAAHLANLPLWHDDPMPPELSDNWLDLRQTLLDLDQDWDVWIDWYEDRLHGRPANQDLEIARLTLPEELWEQGPEAVNPAIKRLTELHQVKATEQSQFGPRWKQSETGFAAIRQGDTRDEAVASEPRTLQIHGNVSRKLAEFAKRYPEIEANYGWDGFADCLDRFKSSIEEPLGEIPANILGLYDATVELGSYLDLHHDLLRRSLGNQAALDPIPARAFTDLVRTSALFVRAFPSALEADEAVSGFLTRPDLFEPAIVVIEAAGKRLLISKEDADFVLGLLHAGQRSGFPSEKAGTRGMHGARNLTLTACSLVASFVFGAVASDYSTKSPLIQNVGDFLVDTENEITELLAEGQSDIRHAIHSLIEEAKNQPPSPGESKVLLRDTAVNRPEEDEENS